MNGNAVYWTTEFYAGDDATFVGPGIVDGRWGFYTFTSAIETTDLQISLTDFIRSIENDEIYN